MSASFSTTFYYFCLYCKRPSYNVNLNNVNYLFYLVLIVYFLSVYVSFVLLVSTYAMVVLHSQNKNTDFVLDLLYQIFLLFSDSLFWKTLVLWKIFFLFLSQQFRLCRRTAMKTHQQDWCFEHCVA